MKTDRKILQKGILYLSMALPLFFLGPVVIHSSFKNEEHPFFIPVLGMGIIASLAAIFLMFSGIRKIMNSMFGK